MMPLLADAGSHIDTSAFLVFVAIALAAAFGSWARHHHDQHAYRDPECANCRTPLRNRYCDPCATRGAERILNAIRNLEDET